MIEQPFMKKRFFRFFYFLIQKNNSINPESLETVDYLFGLLAFFIPFSVYLLALIPTVGFYDSGELITA